MEGGKEELTSPSPILSGCNIFPFPCENHFFEKKVGSEPHLSFPFSLFGKFSVFCMRGSKVGGP